MNILMLAPDFYPVWGGSGTYAIQIAKNMPKEHFLHIITPKRTQFNDKKLESEEYFKKFPKNVQIHYIGNSNNTFYYNFEFQRNCRKYIKNFIKSHDINILHSQSSMPDIFISPRKIGVPIVTTVHTTIEGQINAIKATRRSFNELDSSEKMTRFLGFPLKHLENMYYKSERNFITVSNWAKRELIEEKNIEENKIDVVHNGVDIKDFKFSKKESKDYFPELYDLEVPKVLYLSRMINYKGVYYLIKSIKKILDKVDAHFIFAGPGKKPKLDIPRENYSFLGYVPYEKTPFLHKLSDIFVLPSVYENLPMSILEAMASESVVITTGVGGIPEVINDKNGILIPIKNSEIISESILKLTNNKELRLELGKEAKSTVENNFNMDINIKKTISCYEKVLNKSNFNDNLMDLKDKTIKVT